MSVRYPHTRTIAVEIDAMPTPAELYNEHEQLKDAGLYQEAIGKLTEALAQDDKFVMAHLGLAILYGKMGLHEKGVFHAQSACTLEPNDAFNYTTLSVACQRASQGATNAGDNARYIRMAEDAMARAHMLQGRR
jgi:tetratricopeptide (TPR) repeat protein